MKPLRILGFALTLGFLAPLAQAAPGGAPEPAHVDAPAPAAPDRHDDAPPQAAPERHNSYVPPHADAAPGAPPRDHDRQHADAQAVIYTQAPDADGDQDSVPVDNNQLDTGTDDSCEDTSASPAHYSMDDLANAMQDLDSSY